MLRISSLIFFINSITAYYISSYNIKLNNNIRDCAVNLIDINNAAMNNNMPSKNLTTFENYGKKSLCYTFETSNLYNCKYKNKILFINPNKYLATYDFNSDKINYNYVFYIKATKIDDYKTSWDIKLKHNYRLLESKILFEDKIINYLSRCINIKTTTKDKMLIDFFK